MPGKTQITADFATQGDVASRLGIPASRTAELREQMSDLQMRMPDGSVIFFEVKATEDVGRGTSSKRRSAVRVSAAKKK